MMVGRYLSSTFFLSVSPNSTDRKQNQAFLFQNLEIDLMESRAKSSNAHAVSFINSISSLPSANPLVSSSNTRNWTAVFGGARFRKLVRNPITHPHLKIAGSAGVSTLPFCSPNSKGPTHADLRSHEGSLTFIEPRIDIQRAGINRYGSSSLSVGLSRPVPPF